MLLLRRHLIASAIQIVMSYVVGNCWSSCKPLNLGCISERRSGDISSVAKSLYRSPEQEAGRMDQPLKDEVVGTIVDITDRKVSEEAVRRSEAYLAEAQALSHTGSFGWRVSSGEIFWSDETFRIFECGPGTKPTVDLALSRVHPDDRELVQQHLDRAQRNSTGFDFSIACNCPMGHEARPRDRSSLADRAGNLEFVGAITDLPSNAVRKR